MIRVAVFVTLYIISIIKSNEQVMTYTINNKVDYISNVVATSYKASKGIRFIKLTH